VVTIFFPLTILVDLDVDFIIPWLPEPPMPLLENDENDVKLKNYQHKK
jgi:hypothetical protein